MYNTNTCILKGEFSWRTTTTLSRLADSSFPILERRKLHFPGKALSAILPLNYLHMKRSTELLPTPAPSVTSPLRAVYTLASFSVFPSLWVGISWKNFWWISSNVGTLLKKNSFVFSRFINGFFYWRKISVQISINMIYF